MLTQVVLDKIQRAVKRLYLVVVVVVVVVVVINGDGGCGR